MNLIYFIRLLSKNLLLIFGVAIFTGVIVYVATRNQPKTYTASSTVLIRLATSYEIESGANNRFDLFSNHAQFANLINIIKSRESQERTAIRLMAQHLILTKPDPRYCLPETWRKLMSEVPVEIKLMADNSYIEKPVNPRKLTPSNKDNIDSAQPGKEALSRKAKNAVMESRTVTGQVKRFSVKTKYYTIKSGDSPNVICQKFGLTLNELYLLNSPMPPFQGGQRVIVGTFSEPYRIGTVLNKEVAAEVEAVVPDTIFKNAALVKPNPSDTATRSLTPGYNADIVSDGKLLRYERLVADMTAFKNANQDNYLFNTLQSSNPYYSVQKISGVKVTRIQSSDLLKLTFDSNDPAVCMQTLKILTDEFKSQYQSITTTQTGLVSEYFQGRVNAAKKQLDSLEQSLLTFRMENRIINYDEQTKFISEQKETLDRDWYAEAGKLSAAKTALALIEENLGEKDKSILQNSTVLEKRQRVYELALKLSMQEIKKESNIKQDSVLQKWLEKAIEVEESQARFNTLTDRKKASMTKYDEFAPLGSKLKKIEREIDLAQQDYMNHLNNLNQSIMKQKNVEQSDIQIIDNPVYPIKPNASKRMITVIAAFMAGLVLTASLIILLEFLDNSLKFPMRFAELSGLKLMGAFPRIPVMPDHRVNYPLISSRAIDQIAQRIRLEDLRVKNRGEQPFILFFISTQEKEGKTFLATKVVEKLRASGSKVLYVKQLDNNSPDEIKRQFIRFDLPQQAWDYEYTVPDNFVSIRNINELLRNYTFLTKGYHFMVIELPALLVQGYPATLTESGQLTILVGRATRAWNQADEESVRLYNSSIDHPVLALLNGCQVDQLEPIIGEIPKRRSLIRKLIKRIINLDFKTQEKV